MAKNNGITKYMEKYFDTQFGHIHEEIKAVRSDVKVIKNDLKKNGECLHKIEKVMTAYKLRVRTLFILVGFIIVLLVLGLANGLELVTKGILGFIR